MKKKHYFLRFAVPLALLYWLLDSLIHYFWYRESAFEIIPSDANDLWMRISIFIVLVAFGLFADYASKKSIEKSIIKNRTDNIARAKKQWELAVDSLPQLVIAMDHNANIARVNRTAETWGISKVDHVDGLHISDFLKSLANIHNGEDEAFDWPTIWQQFASREIQEWQVAQNNTGRVYQYTLKRISDYDPGKDQFYAVLTIEDITALQDKEESLKRHALELEQKVNERTLALKQANARLDLELQAQIRAEKALKESQQCRMDLLRDLITAQESERKRIACELHDSIGQSLGATKFKVEELLLNRNNELNELENSQLSDVVDKIKNVIHEVRHIAMDLRPAMLDDLGTLTTLKWFCREFESTYKDISVNKLLNIEEADISEDKKVVIFRIAQEAMNNVVKHSNASNIELELSKYDSGLMLSISDDGCGIDTGLLANKNRIDFNMDESIPKCSFGLSSMRERAESTNGEFSIEPAPGCGTRVRVFWKN